MVEYGKYNMEAIYPDCLTPAYPLCHLYHHGMFSTFVYKTQKGWATEKDGFHPHFCSHLLCQCIICNLLRNWISYNQLDTRQIHLKNDLWPDASFERCFQVCISKKSSSIQVLIDINKSEFQRSYQVFKFWKMLTSQHFKEVMKHSNFERFYQVSISNML